MPQPRSAGVLLYRERDGATQVLLIRPGGPFWRGRDIGAWMIPKGTIEPGETPAQAALREFEEETGTKLAATPYPLLKIRQAGGKHVEAFALEGDLDASRVRSNECEIEWPPRSGRRMSYPEVVEARWMTFAQARAMMLPSQLPLIDALEEKLRDGA